MNPNAKTKRALKKFYSRAGLKQHKNGHVLKAPMKVERIIKIMGIENRDIILDIGCARGEILYKLVVNAEFAVGIDLSPNVFEKARKSKKINYILADAEYIPLTDETFSKIICLDLLEHVLEPEKVIMEMKRLLRKDGKIILEVPSTGVVSSLLTGDFHDGHLRYYTRKKIGDILHKHELSIEKLELFNSVPLSTFLARYKTLLYLLNSLVNIIPNRIYPWFGAIVLCVTLKKSCVYDA